MGSRSGCTRLRCDCQVRESTPLGVELQAEPETIERKLTEYTDPYFDEPVVFVNAQDQVLVEHGSVHNLLAKHLLSSVTNRVPTLSAGGFAKFAEGMRQASAGSAQEFFMCSGRLDRTPLPDSVKRH